MDADVVVLGAGAAGLVASARSAASGARTLVLEKNTKAGVKILMSGGTRCNLTHDCGSEGIMEAFGRNGRFLRQALAQLDPQATIAMFHGLGVRTKVEVTGKVFPISDRAVEVRDALLRQACEAGAEVRLSVPVLSIQPEGEGFAVAAGDQTIRCRKLIVTVGGRSWPGCGTRGDGYGWLEGLGHRIVRPRPSLVPLTGGNSWSWGLSGLTLEDVFARVWVPERREPSTVKTEVPGDEAAMVPLRYAKRPAQERRGGFLFTHFGFSGPVVMDISRGVTSVEDCREARVEFDFCPKLAVPQLHSHLDDARRHRGSTSLANLISEWIPKRLGEALVGEMGIDGIPTGELSRRRQEALVGKIKQYRPVIDGTRGFDKAEVTAGGVALEEVDPRTMESRKIPGLYIAGEILDLDGWIGGYNFQSAFSTGHVAGTQAAASLHNG